MTSTHSQNSGSEPAEVDEAEQPGAEVRDTEAGPSDAAGKESSADDDAPTETVGDAFPTAEPARPVAAGSHPEPAGLWWRRGPIVALAAVCAVALIVTAVFGVLLLGHNARESARTEALRTGTEAAAVLLSYDHSTLNGDLDRRMDMLAADYRQTYRSMVADRVAPAAKARKVVTESSVVASSVVDVPSNERVVLLLFVNQSSSTPVLPEPLMTGSRVQMTLDEIDGQWLVSELQPL